MDILRSIARNIYRYWIFIGVLFLSDIIIFANSQEILQGGVSGTPVSGRENSPNGNTIGHRSSDATNPSTDTSPYQPTSSIRSNPPVPLESGRQTPSASGLVSVVVIAAVISVSAVACVAFFGGMYCWYKHAGMVSSARRVFYRSSDSKVLIHNDYQPMGDEVETNHNGDANKKMAKLAEKTDYPAYGVTGPNPLYGANKGPPIDVNLTRNAEVYHYQQQKQRLKKLNSMSSNAKSHSKHSMPEMSHDPKSDDIQGDEENSDGEYTVYECPGLAAASDAPLEIHNPLFANSDTNLSSYTASTLGGSVVTSQYDYSTTVGGR